MYYHTAFDLSAVLWSNDMYDKSLIAHLLPSEMIIKNYIYGNPDCNYEKYLLEFINASDYFLAKSNGDIYKPPFCERHRRGYETEGDFRWYKEFAILSTEAFGKLHRPWR